MKKYVVVIPLLLTVLTANSMEELSKKKWKKRTNALKQLVTKPEKVFSIEGTSLEEESEKNVRASLVSIINAVYKKDGYLVLDGSQLNKNLLTVLAGDPLIPEKITPRTVALSNTDGKVQANDQMQPDYQGIIQEAITLHYDPPQSPWITANFAMLKKLFATPYILKDRKVTEVIFTDQQEGQKTGIVREFLTEAVALDTREDTGIVTMTVDCNQLGALIPEAKEVGVEKIVFKKPTLLQRFLDPVTLGTAVTVGAVCWFMALHQSE